MNSSRLLKHDSNARHPGEGLGPLFFLASPGSIKTGDS